MENEQRIYTIGDAHLDTSWVWTFETSVKEYIPKTFNENFALFEKYPEYKFNWEGSYRYELMREYYPDAFEKVKKYIAEGRWSPCGSCYENGDVNIPSPEALIRNVIYGNGFFKDNFGIESNDIFLPDCFGFGKALPGIAAHCGLTGFSTQKLTWGCSVPTPFDVGRWKALDGNGLWCAIKPGSYTKVYDKIRTYKPILEKLKENSEKYGFKATFDYHGVGDRGGAPKEKSVKAVCEEIRENAGNAIKVLSATTKEFFDDIEAMSEEAKKKLPVFDGEFLMTEHGAGSYTSRTASKRFNRRSELLADAAERSAVSAFILGLADYPSNVFDTAWKRTIAHQFHDDITGTSWMIDYKRNWNDYVQSLNLFSTEYTAAVKAVTGAMNTAFAQGVAVAVSSPVQTSGVVKQAVKAYVEESKLPGKFIRVFDSKGIEVPSQLGSADKKGFKKVIFMAEVPANGIAVYDVRPSDSAFEGETGLSLKNKVLKNNRYTVKLDLNGDIASVYDSKLDKELLAAPVRNELVSDITYYHYSAWEVHYKDIARKPYAYAGEPVFLVKENGPALCEIEVIRVADGSTFKQYISLDAESDFIRVFNEVDWRTESANLKVRFPVNANNDIASYDIGIGSYGRKTNTKEQFEVPAQRWTDITGVDGKFGVSILSDSRSGWDKPDGHTLRLTGVHTATNNHSYMTGQHLADFGINRFSYGIYGHEGNPDYTACAADRFCQPMHAFVCDTHKGKLDPVFSLCSVDSDTVRILGIKKAQKSDEIVIRLCEYTGKEQKGVKLSFVLPLISASEIRGDEELIGDAAVKEGNLVIDFKPHEIKSFMLKLNGVKKYRKKYGEIELPLNAEISSANCDGKKAKLNNGYSVPAELIPAELLEGGITYNFKNSGLNAVESYGQVIDVPKGAKTAHFILTSISGDKEVAFKADDKEFNVTVQSCFEAVGAWDLIGLGETGYIKKNPQYFTFTHTHGARGDEIAKQFYLFHAEIPCDKCSKITLPFDKNIFILSASYSKDTNEAIPADEHFDSLDKREFNYTYSCYAKKLLKESRYSKAMEKVVKKVEGIEPKGKFTQERKEKLRKFLNNTKDNTMQSFRTLRAAELYIKREIKK